MFTESHSPALCWGKRVNNKFAISLSLLTPSALLGLWLASLLPSTGSLELPGLLFPFFFCYVDHWLSQTKSDARIYYAHSNCRLDSLLFFLFPFWVLSFAFAFFLFFYVLSPFLIQFIFGFIRIYAHGIHFRLRFSNFFANVREKNATFLRARAF